MVKYAGKSFGFHGSVPFLQCVNIIHAIISENVDRNRIVREIAQRYDATPRQIVLAWLLARSPSILPIPGTGSVSHVDDNVAAAAIKLAPADVASLTDNAG